MEPDRQPEHDALVESSRSQILWPVVLPLASSDIAEHVSETAPEPCARVTLRLWMTQSCSSSCTPTRRCQKPSSCARLEPLPPGYTENSSDAPHLPSDSITLCGRRIVVNHDAASSGSTAMSRVTSLPPSTNERTCCPTTARYCSMSVAWVGQSDRLLTVATSPSPRRLGSTCALGTSWFIAATTAITLASFGFVDKIRRTVNMTSSPAARTRLGTALRGDGRRCRRGCSGRTDRRSPAVRATSSHEASTDATWRMAIEPRSLRTTLRRHRRTHWRSAHLPHPGAHIMLDRLSAEG